MCFSFFIQVHNTKCHSLRLVNLSSNIKQILNCQTTLHFQRNTLKRRKYVLFVSHGNQSTCVWRLKQEAFDKEGLKCSVKFAAFVIVWGLHDWTRPGRLCIVSMPSFENFCDDDFIFQVDLVFFHTSKSTTKGIQEKDINVLSWLSNLPDLSHIENLWELWKTTSRNCTKRQKDLISSLKNIWAYFI